MRSIHIQACLAAFLILFPVLLNAEEKDSNTTKVTGVFHITAEDAAIDGVTLVVQLWEYAPRLADAGAKLVEKVEVKDVKHEKGTETKVKFTVGEKGTVMPNRNYYVTVRGYKGDKYVYYGKPSHDDIGRVITEGKPREIEFHGKRQK